MTAPQRDRSATPAVVIASATTLLLGAPLGLAVVIMLMSGGGCQTSQAPANQSAAADIPPQYLQLYQQAGQRYAIPWPILAGIGKAESDHGRADDPGVRFGANHAGAMGPMQFLADSWRRHGGDGNGDGNKNVYDPADAIPAAARYLRAAGAPQQMHRAIFAYNHADWYVQRVLTFARRYAAGADLTSATAQSTCDVENVAASSSVAARVLAYAHAQLGKPYLWGAAGPDSFDCSGLTMRAYQHAGITIPRVSFTQWTFGIRVSRGQEQPGDLVFFNSGPNSGPGRPGHVGIVLNPQRQLMIAAPRTGDVVKISSYRRSDLLGFTRPSLRAANAL